MSTCPALHDKLMTLSQAVSRFVGNGAHVALGGFTINRIRWRWSTSRAPEETRPAPCVPLDGQALDLLVGAGCVGRIESPTAETAASPHLRALPQGGRARRSGGRGLLHYQMALRSWRRPSVPFVPTQSGSHTDLVRRSGFSRQYRAAHGLPPEKLAVIADPFDDGGDVVLLPALTPDVALMHAHYVGHDGTVRIKGLTSPTSSRPRQRRRWSSPASDRARRRAARRRRPERLRLLRRRGRAAEARRSATACRFFYDYDSQHLNEYKRVARDDQATALARAVGVRPGDHDGTWPRSAASSSPAWPPTRCAATPSASTAAR